jgi:hypothetical protein
MHVSIIDKVGGIHPSAKRYSRKTNVMDRAKLYVVRNATLQMGIAASD